MNELKYSEIDYQGRCKYSKVGIEKAKQIISDLEFEGIYFRQTLKAISNITNLNSVK